MIMRRRKKGLGETIRVCINIGRSMYKKKKNKHKNVEGSVPLRTTPFNGDLMDTTLSPETNSTSGSVSTWLSSFVLTFEE